MPFTSDHREWLGNVLHVSRFELGSNDDKLDKARQAYDRVVARIEGTALLTILKQELPNDFTEFDKEKSKAKTKPEEYATSQKAIEILISKAMDRKIKKQEELTDKFASLKPALIFARETIKAHGELEESAKGQILKAAESILKHEANAVKARDEADYKLAAEEIDKAIKLFDLQQALIKSTRDDVLKETENAKQSEQQAFKLFVGTKKEMREMVGDPDVMQLMLGGKLNIEGKGEKSQALLAMEKVFTIAVARFDKLMKSGVNAPDAADVAFANFPRAFWPDRAIREIDMFYRVERQIELEEANQEASSLRDKVEGFKDGAIDPLQEYVGELGVGTVTDTLESVARIRLKLNTKDDLPKIDSKEFKLLPKKEQDLLKLQDKFGTSTKAIEGFGVALKAITVLAKTYDAMGDQGGPVQKKIVEFERNAALFDLAAKAKDYGANLLKDVCPALGIAAGAVDIAVSMYKAAKYFKKLYDIQKLGEKAERDPKSVVYLPLIRMDKHERLKAAEQVMTFIEKSLAVAGKSAQLSGIGAPAGLGIDVAGKIVAQGSKFVFANIKWSDAKKAQKAIHKAKGPPIDREMVAEVFKYSNKYATYCLAIAAVEDNDPWAVRYCTTSGLEEGEVKDPATSIMVLRKYILVEAAMDDVQETFADTLVGKSATALVEGFGKVKDFATGRKKWADYDPDAVIGAASDPTRTNWQAAKKQALNCGWYDDRSGLGDYLTEYELSLANWENAKKKNSNYLSQPTPQEAALCEAACAAANQLRLQLQSLRPLAKDEITPHAGMTQYVNDMWSKVSEVNNALSNERTVVLGSFAKSPEGQKQVDDAKKDLETASDDRLTDLKKAISDFIIAAKWDTPFGECKLDDFEALVCEALPLSPVAVNGKIHAAAQDLKKLLTEQAQDLLGSYTAQTVAEPLQIAFKKQLQSNAYGYFVRLGVLARELKAKLMGTSTNKIDLSGYASLEARNWLDAIKMAQDNGLSKWRSGDPSAVTLALRGYASEMNKYNTTGASAYFDNASDFLRQVQEFLEPLEPVDDLGLPFDSFVTLMSLIDKLADIELKKLDKACPSNTFTPTAAELKIDWWEANKKKAVDNHMLRDESTGITKAMKLVESSGEAFGLKKDDDTRLKYAQKLNQLAAAVSKYKPSIKSRNPFKGGKTHGGGVALKEALLEKIESEYGTFEAELLQKMGDAAIFKAPVSESAWSAAKKEFIKFGMVEKKTGLNAAIKAYVAAKSKRDKAPEDEKLKQAFTIAADTLVTTVLNFEPVNSSGKKFEKAVTYLTLLKEHVQNEAGLNVESE